MRLIGTTTGLDLITQATTRPPFGPGFTSDEVDNAERLEIYGSSFKQSGGDYCLFVLKDKNGAVIAQRRIDGY
jgi:hypothetical protein